MSTPPASEPGEPALDLLRDATGQMASLRRALRQRDWLDAYLSSCALFQIVEDRLHPDPLQMRRSADFIARRDARRDTRRDSVAALTAACIAGAAAGVDRLRGLRPATTVLSGARDTLESLTVRLAGAVLADGAAAVEPAPLLAASEALEAAMRAVGDEVARLPACFRDFDQHPQDMRQLTDELIARHDLPVDRPICVVGIRTSGCYLAPLVVARLLQRGHRDIGLLTHRRTRPFSARERARLRACARAGGLAVVVDDPPGSGQAFASTAQAVQRCGFGGSSSGTGDIVLLISRFPGEDELPPALRGWPSVVQRGQDWVVRERLRPEALVKDLTSLLRPGWQVTDCGPVTISDQPRRHVSARFSAGLVDPRGNHLIRDIEVNGTGQGYFGRHPAEIANRMGAALPRVYGFVDGLLYQDAPAQARPGEGTDPRAAMVDYVTGRRRLLPADRDPTPSMRGRNPVWEVAANRLSGMYGPLAPAARLLVLEPLTRRLLATSHPSIVDGATHRRHWSPDPDEPGRLVKHGFDSRAFSNRDLACYDAVYDLAGAAVDLGGDLADDLRDRFEESTGERVDAERWWLYQLVQAWAMGGAGELDAAAVRRRSANAINGYLAEIFPARDGEPTALCGIDLDGVLETGPLGMPTTTPIGTLTLRSLAAHGFSPVPVTGRSLDDARDRCRAFGLRGAVAEYGSVIFRACDHLIRDLRSDAEREAIETARRDIRRAGIDVDETYRYCIRARYRGGPLPPELIRELPVLDDPRFRVIRGEGQTDVVPRGIDKATGLRALIAELGGPPLAMVVGDSAEDLPAMTLAGLAVATGNADAAVRAADIRRTPGHYQSGLADAFSAMVGHRPGGCAVCRYRVGSRRTRLMLAALSLREDGLRGLAGRTARLAGTLAGQRMRELLPARV